MEQIELNDREYDLVTLDFETYYDKDYTLKKMNLSSYIRDPRFLAHLVGIKRGSAPTQWVPCEDIPAALAKIDWTRTALLAHNTAFDGFILHTHYDVHPALYLDTMSMARGIHGAHSPASLDYLAKAHGLKGKEKAGALVNTLGKTVLTKAELEHLGEYCADDCDDTYALFCKLYDHIPDNELRLIHLTLKMFCEPVLLLDEARCRAELEREIREKAEALEYVRTICTVADLQSNEKFAELLRAQGVDPPMKISLRTQKPAYAFAKTDFEFVELMEEGPPIVQALCRARVRNKTTTNETRAQRFLDTGRDGQTIPVALNYCQAHTMRWSGGNKMNLQNLMRGGELRRSLLAPPGYRLVVADSSQIEARMLAWLSGEARLVELFAAGEDVYKHMAALIYGVPVSEVTKDQRFVGKVAVLGLGYGMGGQKFNDTLAKGAMGPKVVLPMDETKRIVSAYRFTNTHITDMWKRAEQILIDMMLGRTGEYGPLSWGKNFVRMPNGLFMHYRGLTGEVYQGRYGDARLSDAYYLGRGDAKNYIYGGLAVENWTQCLARIAVGEQLLDISERYRIVTTTHDEIVALAPEDEADECLEFMIRRMSQSPDWAPGLPLAAEGGHDVCYSK